jgi:hypothetical protein
VAREILLRLGYVNSHKMVGFLSLCVALIGCTGSNTVGRIATRPADCGAD